MAQERYDLTHQADPEQRRIALFWNDNPDGKCYTATGHWMSILNQVLAKENVKLDKAAVAYLRVGLALSAVSAVALSWVAFPAVVLPACAA